MKNWIAPSVTEANVGREVTSYAAAEIDII
jgi:coenzyme PQQ precursor peptide PqqA